MTEQSANRHGGSGSPEQLLRQASEAMRGESGHIQVQGRALTEAEKKRVQALNDGVSAVGKVIKSLEANPAPGRSGGSGPS